MRIIEGAHGWISPRAKILGDRTTRAPRSRRLWMGDAEFDPPAGVTGVHYTHHTSRYDETCAGDDK